MVVFYLKHQVDEKRGQPAAVSGMTEWLFAVIQLDTLFYAGVELKGKTIYKVWFNLAAECLV